MTEGAKASAGALLRAAREKQGLHIAALAAAIKVSPRKLDALEHDRYDELPDATFARALAQTVCRSLKIDPQPVLALLPQADAAALDQVGGSLNAPFRDRPGRGEPGGLATAAIRPMVGAGVALLVAAAVVYFVPAEFWQSRPMAVASAPAVAPAPSPAASAASAPGVETAAPLATPAAASAAAPPPAASAAIVETVFSAPPLDAPASAPGPAKLVQLRADDPSWIEARDAAGQVLFSRVVQRGESVGFDGALPIRLTIGNAPGTRLAFRGKPVDLAPSTRDSVARIELQ